MRSMTHPQAPVKVLKIAGLGRSGSTILDIALGNHPSIESVGEVGNLMRTGWVSRGSLHGIERKKRRVPLCTCGKRLDVLYVGSPEEACPFWSEVRREWVERTSDLNGEGIEGYPRLQDAFERQRRWPRLLYEGLLGPSAAFRSYAALTLAFFESIRAVSGKPFVVDSATVPAHAYAFGMVPGMELYVVHLVRDGRGVITSNRKTFKKERRAGMWKTVARWISLNLTAEWVCASLGPKKTLRLRYEDFVSDPDAALSRIGSLLGLDLSGVAEAARAGEPMLAGHNVGGNRTKKSGAITLRPDAREWKSDLSAAEQRLAWVSMGWLMRRYGYER